MIILSSKHTLILLSKSCSAGNTIITSSIRLRRTHAGNFGRRPSSSDSNLHFIYILLYSEATRPEKVIGKRLNEQVKRNSKRFPKDFMFQLTIEEKNEVVAKCDHLRKIKFSSHLPNAFTEHGIVILASVLNSERAIDVNIQIVKIFINMREVFLTHKELLLMFEEMEKKLTGQDEKIYQLFTYLKQFIKEQETPRKEIGFKSNK